MNNFKVNYASLITSNRSVTMKEIARNYHAQIARNYHAQRAFTGLEVSKPSFLSKTESTLF